jgi:hypothetical protein
MPINKIKAGSIDTGSITSAKIAADAVTSAKIANDTIANADISSSAAIAYSKLNLATSIANADISSSAAIAYSKLNLGTSITSSDLASTVITGATSESTIAGGDQILIYDDSASALRKMTRTNFVSGLGSGFDTQLFHVRDERANGTGGGAFISGSFQTRPLNTVMTNEISGASLSSNQITLPSGTYYIFAQAKAYTVNAHKIRFRNMTDSLNTIVGDQSRADASYNVSNDVFVIGRFTISAQKTFELQHRCETTRGDANGFGISSGYSEVEVHANVSIWKVA